MVFGYSLKVALGPAWGLVTFSLVTMNLNEERKQNE